MGEPTPPAAPDTERSRALTRQANALRAEGRWEEALPLCFAALQADANNAAAAHNLGVLLSKIGRLAEGETAFRHALSLSPDVPIIVHALAHNLLAQGRYAEGWPLYEVRALMPELNTGFPKDFPFPLWRGESLAGKRLAIFPEQGLGDQIQFARFLPGLMRDAGAITLLTMLPLERLYRYNFPQADIVLADGKVEFADPDYWITLHDLAKVLKIGIDNIPNAPYLRAAEVRPSLGSGFKIGLKTKGNPAHTNDRLRSLPEANAERLRGQLPGSVFSLEPADSGSKDMADTAALIDQLDLIVSVDTSVAHLAGAMGKPCLLLIPGYNPDWRWMIGRDDSPWYPGHRLFRSAQDGNWRPAIDRLIAEAARRADAALPRPALPPRGKDGALAQLLHRATALRNEARYSEALDLMRRAVRSAPGNAGAVNILGTMLRDIGLLDEAETCHRRALAFAPTYPGCADALAYTLLARGAYREAWPLHKARSEVSSPTIGFPTDMPCPRWQGEPLEGRHIAIMPEQGFGDQIQFARFLPMLRELGPKISLFAPLALTGLFQSSFPWVKVRSAEGQVPLGKPDYWTTLVDMAQPLDVTIETVGSPPYLKTTRTWPPLPAGFKIGLQTKGSAKHANDAWRSLSPADAERLRAILPGQIIDLDPVASGAADFAETAALVQQLDLVVSVDTSVAHLAGALGKPCLLLIPGIATDWRWMRDRDDSSWYPHHRLYRSAPDASWDDAIRRVGVEAEARAKAAAPDMTAQTGKLAANSAVVQRMQEVATLCSEGRYPDAVDLARDVQRSAPDNPAANNILGRVLGGVGRLKDAELYHRRALALAPDYPKFRNELGLNLLAQGRYREAWPLHEARAVLGALAAGFSKDVRCSRWRGESLAGKHLVVLPEQGFGDEIQFARFIPQLLTLGGRVTLYTKPPLVALLRASFPDVAIRPADGTVDLGGPDYWTTLIDMAGPLDVTPQTLPALPYIRTDAVWPTLPAGVNVGIATSGNLQHANDAWRSLPAATAARLRAALPGRVFGLDPRESGAENFAETAALLERLDLIVSVDTSVGHLAGALGRPVLLLVPGISPDWRWMQARGDSIWYPRHRLYRGDIDGGWDSAIDALIGDAHAIAAAAR